MLILKYSSKLIINNCKSNYKKMRKLLNNKEEILQHFDIRIVKRKKKIVYKMF